MFVIRGIKTVMSEKIFRLYVKKKKGFDIESQGILNDIKSTLGMDNIKNIEIINRYDICGIDENELNRAKNIIFSDAVTDEVYEESINIEEHCKVFASTYLPGQYDQRADSAIQCIQILTG